MVDRARNFGYCTQELVLEHKLFGRLCDARTLFNGTQQQKKETLFHDGNCF
jgi:hypothetical protein